MKPKFFTLTTPLIGLILLVSCSSSKSSTKKYPFPGSPAPQEKSPGQQPTDKNGADQNSNAAHPTNLPPGQAKKIYGEKSAKVFAPGQRKKQGNHYYPLIVLKTPDIIILRHTDGRYYFKNSDNLIYWKGNDERFYLDEQYLEDVEYDKNELNDWKGKGKVDSHQPPGQEKKDKDKEKEHAKGKDKKSND
jgi:hypothetical protein